MNYIIIYIYWKLRVYPYHKNKLQNRQSAVDIRFYDGSPRLLVVSNHLIN